LWGHWGMVGSGERDGSCGEVEAAGVVLI